MGISAGCFVDSLLIVILMYCYFYLFGYSSNCCIFFLHSTGHILSEGEVVYKIVKPGLD